MNPLLTLAAGPAFADVAEQGGGGGDSSAAADAAADPVRVQILDAAVVVLGQRGLRRASVEDIARKARLGRTTIYRRFANKEAVVSAVMAREARRFFTLLAAVVDPGADLVDQVVEAFVVGLRFVRSNDMLSGLLTAEADELLPYLTTEAAPVVAAARTYLVGRALAVAPAIDPVAAEVVAEILVRLAISFWLTPDTSLDLDDDDSARTSLRLYLGPLLRLPGVAN